MLNELAADRVIDFDAVSEYSSWKMKAGFKETKEVIIKPIWQVGAGIYT